MFDFDAGKFLIIGVVALIVIGPKELPRVLRQVGQAVARVRRMAGEFQGQFMDAMKEADLETIRQDLKKIGDDADAQFKVNFDPARDIQRELTTSLETPATASRVPALTEATAVPTEGFALPEPVAGDTTSFAAEGIAPVVDTAEVMPEPHAQIAFERAETAVPNGAMTAPADAGSKRKIRVQKRRRLAVARVHPVSDRTAVTRLRAGRTMGEELAER